MVFYTHLWAHTYLKIATDGYQCTSGRVRQEDIMLQPSHVICGVYGAQIFLLPPRQHEYSGKREASLRISAGLRTNSGNK